MPLIVAFLLGGFLWLGAATGHFVEAALLGALISFLYGRHRWRRFVDQLRTAEMQRDRRAF